MTQLIVALDAPLATSKALFYVLKKHVAWFKIELPTLLDLNGATLASIVAYESNLMLDLKAYSTYDTMARIMREVDRIGVEMVTVHGDCVKHALGKTSAKILTVRALTDNTNDEDGDLGDGDGVICSVAVAQFFRPLTKKLLVCPGIRPAGAPGNNHTAPATPSEAREAGADFIVVGRPIWQADDPVAATRRILEELG